MEPDTIERGEYEPRGQIVLLGILKTIGISENRKFCGRYCHTWAYVIGAACFEFFTESVRNGQAEIICDGETSAAVKAEQIQPHQATAGTCA